MRSKKMLALIVLAVAGMSVQYESPANGPSVGVVHVGGLPLKATEPVPP